MTEQRRVLKSAAAAMRSSEEEQDLFPPSPRVQVASTEAPTGEQSEPGDAGGGATWTRPTPVLDSEVAAKPMRRSFTAAYKLSILEEVERASSSGEIGGILRREGLYSSHLTAWRKARRAGALRRLSQRRGRKPQPADPLARKVEQLERELSRTREALRRAELIIDVQGKVARLLGFSLEDGRSS